MYIAISLQKVIENREEAEALLYKVREKVSNVEGVKITALFVDDMTNPTTTPKPDEDDRE